MPVIVRDQVASTHLVYAWPFPIGPEPVEVSCADDEIVVMCPAWVVGQPLGPGRHSWRTPDPSKPTHAYFVLTAPVETPFDVMTSFVIPATQQPVRLRAQGSLLVRCGDPGSLIAQFVGLPFNDVNTGLMRSVANSVERLLSRVLVRRVVAASNPAAVTDPAALASIIDEVTAYNPTAGAVTGVHFVRFNQLLIHADDGGLGAGAWHAGGGWAGQPHAAAAPSPAYPTGGYAVGGYPHHDPSYQHAPYATGAFGTAPSHDQPTTELPATPSPPPPDSSPGGAISSAMVSGEIGVVSGEIGANKKRAPIVPSSAAASAGSSPSAAPVPVPVAVANQPTQPTPSPPATPPSPPAGPPLLPVGARVLVSSPDGSLHSSTIRQHQQGYYEVEVGGTGHTVWIPVGQVIPEGQ